jgi:hypothetical protein
LEEYHKVEPCPPVRQNGLFPQAHVACPGARESRKEGRGRGGSFGQLTWGISSAIRTWNEPGLSQGAATHVNEWTWSLKTCSADIQLLSLSPVH